ncbi:MAG: SDR family oxidoreductase [Chlorobiaceae bacterium]
MSFSSYNPFSADCFMRYALITGASMGIGEAFAREFAKRGRNLVLVARSVEKLLLLAEELRQESGIKVEVCPADLNDLESPARIYDFCRCRQTEVDLLINCAGLSRAGNFDDISIEKLEEIMVVNMMALVKLTRIFLPEMIDRKNGGIINVASLGGFQGVPGLGLYSATKSFVIVFTEALHVELKNKGISVVAVCPGFIDTGIFERSGHNAANIRLPLFGTGVVVKAGIKGLIKNKIRVFPTLLDYVLVFSQRFVSREIAIRLAGFFSAVN